MRGRVVCGLTRAGSGTSFCFRHVDPPSGSQSRCSGGTLLSEKNGSTGQDSESSDGSISSLLEMRRVNGLSLDRIRNAVEVIACRLLEKKLSNMPEVCQCQQCVEDMYCVALNRVPALYYHSTSSFARRLDDQGPPGDILRALDGAIDQAIMKVGQNPSHKDDSSAE